VLAVVLAGLALAAAAPQEAGAALSAPVVPRSVERRIAATFGANGFIPSWLPKGLAFQAYWPNDPYKGAILNYVIDYTYKRHADPEFDWSVDIEPDRRCTSKDKNPDKRIWTVRGHKIRIESWGHYDVLYTCIHRGRRVIDVDIGVNENVPYPLRTQLRILGGLRLARR
jgi:hypothetical protein